MTTNQNARAAFEVLREALNVALPVIDAHGDKWQSDMIRTALAEPEPAVVAESAEQRAVPAHHKLYGGIVRAAIGVLVACEECHDAKAGPQRYGVPYGAINALRDALEGHAPAAQQAAPSNLQLRDGGERGN